MSRCASCGTALQHDDRFCSECGGPVRSADLGQLPSGACRVCGSAVSQAMRFCTKCGTAVALTETKRGETRRRNVTRAVTAGDSNAQPNNVDSAQDAGVQLPKQPLRIS